CSREEVVVGAMDYW
nr:immunoglobulin heavy chain junction region [Mus musculus]MBK4187256.1 immunoglobulin heavy chain junction region [Mus musculus]MBK4195264.1 immunoglobulin heavy chain junction region [Mus musculus]